MLPQNAALCDGSCTLTQRQAEPHTAGAGAEMARGVASIDKSICLFLIWMNAQRLQLGGAALLMRCFVEAIHELGPCMLAVIEEQLVCSVWTLVPVSLPNSSGENSVLLKVSAFPLLSS